MVAVEVGEGAGRAGGTGARVGETPPSAPPPRPARVCSTNDSRVAQPGPHGEWAANTTRARRLAAAREGAADKGVTKWGVPSRSSS